ncbi:hypothetical protein CONCODRAFT_134078 [Conidiobolus coronatus NRRL 28638]|uniref:Uncharacterized protein n=1 Tax=Conidiobolus coronatus (strain ATCC 28846 / CBS 209.66 / NRRL 28638) TaxID=796925 RepID=A0A137NTR4_CONC2|nr:hypothetical protein CONCODRAFT_134078 [Conidiobolus coronatus NRRL 28638]|eukprot:KXN66014.1 hypothetical protein CONCODRAFT_134078 [Conidiobolus coronatus NRRL 28638]
MIEKISGSEQLKADYERLKFEQSRATELSGYNFNKKRGMASEIRNFKDQEEEARKYNGLRDQMVNYLYDYSLTC